MAGKVLWIALTVLATGLMAAPPPAERRDSDEAARETARLQGDWVMVSLEVRGKKADESQTRTWRLVVEGDEYNPGSGEFSIEYTFRLDPTLTPKAIDLIPTEGAFQNRVFRGVYALEGDTFTVCRPIDPADDRPGGLTSRPGSGTTRTVWKRRKP